MKSIYTRDMEDSSYVAFYGWVDNRRHKFRYNHKYRFMWRRPRTMNELRQLRFDDHFGLPIRRGRLRLPTLWDDVPLTRNFGKSWKDYTKKRRQWEDR